MANTGCCGMDCDGCEARRATVRRDNEALAKIAAHLESAGQGSFILPSRLRCTGCLAPGVKIAAALHRLPRARRQKRKLRRMRDTRVRARKPDPALRLLPRVPL